MSSDNSKKSEPTTTKNYGTEYWRFKRTHGLFNFAYDWILEIITNIYHNRKLKSGRPSQFTLKEQFDIFLAYLKGGVTLEFLASMKTATVSTIYRAIVLIKELINESPFISIEENVAYIYPWWLVDPSEPLFIDATESRINRPSKDQKSYYSGKKKAHTIKVQVTNLQNMLITTLVLVKGAVHDVKLLQQTYDKVINEGQTVVVDKGYTGFEHFYPNSLIPKRTPRGGSLTDDEKERNKVISSFRMVSEHTIGRIKNFNILQNRIRAHKFVDIALIAILGLLTNLNDFIEEYKTVWELLK